MPRKPAKNSKRPTKKSAPLFLRGIVVLFRLMLWGLWSGMLRGMRNHPHQMVYWTLGITFIFAIFGSLFYFSLSPKQQDEFGVLLKNTFDHSKKVTFYDFLTDLRYMKWGKRHIPYPDSFPNDAIFHSQPLNWRLPYTVKIIQNHTYTVGYNVDLNNPAWVAYEIFDVSGEPQKWERPPFKADSRLHNAVQPEDYSQSGYDRGHLAPNFGIGRCYGSKGAEETFLMSNITPQPHGMNAGPWKVLEMRESLNYSARFNRVAIVTGPLFYHRQPRKIKGKIALPDAFFKIIVVRNSLGLIPYAYLIPQDAEGVELEKYRTSIDEIEKLSGLDFFPKLDDETERALEAEGKAA